MSALPAMLLNRGLPAFIGLVACAAAAGWARIAPSDVLRGWLVAFVVLIGTAHGAIAFQCIGRLTGGRWVEAASPAMRRAMAAAPAISLAFIPVLLGARFIFPWANGAALPRADISRFYLDGALFASRGGVALAGLAFIAFWILLGRGGRLFAALSLIFYTVAVNFIAIDWLLSLAPGFTSSSFGAEIAIQNLLCALALALTVAEPHVQGMADLAMLTLACALGVLYMVAMALIVIWYGDQPDGAKWVLGRAHGAPLVLGCVAFALGAAGPIIALLFERARRSRPAQRWIGVSVLAGVLSHDLWIVGANGAMATAALLSLLAIGGLCIAFSAWLLDRLPAGADAHAP
jgi:hypothetical protein